MFSVGITGLKRRLVLQPLESYFIGYLDRLHSFIHYVPFVVNRSAVMDLHIFYLDRLLDKILLWLFTKFELNFDSLLLSLLQSIEQREAEASQKNGYQVHNSSIELKIILCFFHLISELGVVYFAQWSVYVLHEQSVAISHVVISRNTSLYVWRLDCVPWWEVCTKVSVCLLQEKRPERELFVKYEYFSYWDCDWIPELAVCYLTLSSLLHSGTCWLCTR